MANTFAKRLDALSRQIGKGTLRGLHYRSQPYAAAQEVRDYYNHPRGGQAHYTAAALYDGYRDWYRRLARNLLRGDLSDAMAESMNDFDAAASRRAPIESGRLRASGAVIVTDGGVETYHRPQAAPYNVAKTRGVPGS